MIDQVGTVPDPVHAFFNSIQTPVYAGQTFLDRISGCTGHQPAASVTGTVRVTVSVVPSGKAWVIVTASPSRA